MLVLKRRLDESLQIGTDCRVKVLHISPTAVTLGVEAPNDTGVYRGEVWESIKRQAATEADRLDGTPRRADG